MGTRPVPAAPGAYGHEGRGAHRQGGLTMKRASILAFCAVLLATVMPCFGQQAAQFNFTSPNAGGCDLSGTWYSAGDWKYQWDIVPLSDGRYWGRSQYGFDNHVFGYIAWTEWSGEIIKGKGQTYDSYGISMWVWPPAPGADPNLPPPPEQLELYILHAQIRFVNDCNTFQSTIDVWAGYNPWTAELVPFVTEPDFNYLELLYGGETIVETYHRMPTACPNCPFVGAGKSILGRDMAKLRGKKR